MNNIEFNKITKIFSGKLVLNEISLSINEGSTYCLLGRNGAGKTTLLNILLGLVKPNSGHLSFGATKVHLDYEIKQKMGVLMDDANLIGEFDCVSYLKFCSKLYGIEKEEFIYRMKTLTNYFFENNFRNQSIKDLSVGMKKKIGICAAVLHTPSLLIMDEPFSGLDLLSSKLLIDFLLKYQNGQRIIILSSHNLEYINEFSTHVGVIDNGNLMFNGGIEDFTNNGKTNITEALMKTLSPSNVNIKDLSWL